MEIMIFELQRPEWTVDLFRRLTALFCCSALSFQRGVDVAEWSLATARGRSISGMFNRWIKLWWHLPTQPGERGDSEATGSGRLASGKKSLCHESSLILFPGGGAVHLWRMTSRVHDLSICFLQWRELPARGFFWLCSTKAIKRRRLLPLNTPPIQREQSERPGPSSSLQESFRRNLARVHTAINKNDVNNTGWETNYVELVNSPGISFGSITCGPLPAPDAACKKPVWRFDQRPGLGVVFCCIKGTWDGLAPRPAHLAAARRFSCWLAVLTATHMNNYATLRYLVNSEPWHYSLS